MKKLYITLLALAFCLNGKAQIITTIAGNGINEYYNGDGEQATLADLTPYGIALDAIGNLYIVDAYRIRKVNTAGIISTFAGNGTWGYSGDGGQATLAEVYTVGGLACDAAGNVYIADQSNQRVRKVNTAGIISTVVGNGTQGYSGDGGPATAAELNLPFGVVFDAAGNLYISDQNHCVRMVNTLGIISTVVGNGTNGFSGDGGPATAAELASAAFMAFDATGNLYVSDGGNERIRKVNTLGIITTVAGNGIQGFSGDGGQATSAEFYSPTGLICDDMGNLYMSDTGNERVRKISTSGIITTIAGNGGYSFSGDGGLALDAEFYAPSGLVRDASGNLYVLDSHNYRIRKVTPPLTISVNSPTICAGSTTTLTASGGTSYTWSPAVGLNTTTGSSVIANPTVTTIYTVIGAKGDSMSLITSTVTVLNSLTANSITICVGATATLTANGSSSYTWSTGASTNTATISPNVTSSYTVTGTTGTCTSTTTSTVYVFKPIRTFIVKNIWTLSVFKINDLFDSNFLLSVQS